jgi:DivIVA domain-containing protein
VLVLVVEVLAGVGVLFAVAVLVTGRAGVMAGAAPDRAPVALPEGRALTGGDLSRLRFGVAVRGYRMGDVDVVLDRLATELDARDARLAALEGRSGDDASRGATDAGESTAWSDAAGEPWAGDDERAASEVPAPPAVPSLPGPGGPATGPLTVAPAVWEDPYAATPARADDPDPDAPHADAPRADAPATNTTATDDAEATDEAEATVDGADASGSDDVRWWDDPGWAEDAGWSEDAGWPQDTGRAGSDPADGDAHTDESTEEWRALYDELRPAEPAPQERGDGPRRITGPWGRRPAERDDEGGPWPSSS